MQHLSGLVRQTVSLDHTMPTEHTDDQPALRMVGRGLEVDLTTFERCILVLALGDFSFEDRQQRLITRKHVPLKLRNAAYPVL